MPVQEKFFTHIDACEKFPKFIKVLKEKKSKETDSKLRQIFEKNCMELELESNLYDCITLFWTAQRICEADLRVLITKLIKHLKAGGCILILDNLIVPEKGEEKPKHIHWSEY